MEYPALKNYKGEIEKKMELIAKIDKEIQARKELEEKTVDTTIR